MPCQRIGPDRLPKGLRAAFHLATICISRFLSYTFHSVRGRGKGRRPLSDSESSTTLAPRNGARPQAGFITQIRKGRKLQQPLGGYVSFFPSRPPRRRAEAFLMRTAAPATCAWPAPSHVVTPKGVIFSLPRMPTTPRRYTLPGPLQAGCHGYARVAMLLPPGRLGIQTPCGTPSRQTAHSHPRRGHRQSSRRGPRECTGHVYFSSDGRVRHDKRLRETGCRLKQTRKALECDVCMAAYRQLNRVKFDVDKRMHVAKEAVMKYVVFASRPYGPVLTGTMGIRLGRNRAYDASAVDSGQVVPVRQRRRRTVADCGLLVAATAGLRCTRGQYSSLR